MNAPAVQRPEPADSHLSPESRDKPPPQLVLLGAGMAHLQLLRTLASKPMPEVQVTLVAAETRVVYPAMGPGLLAGDYTHEECTIALEPWVKRAGIRWLQQQPESLDAGQQTLALDDGTSLRYEWLSIDPAPVHNSEQLEQHIPGAGKFGLCAYPLETWAQRWPLVSGLAAKKALRITLMGDDTAALELALAAQQNFPHCVVTMLMLPHAAGARPATAGTTRLLQQLKAQRITVLHDTVLRVDDSAVHLGCGARLACDVPVLALKHLPPTWLAANSDTASLPRSLPTSLQGGRLPAADSAPGTGSQLLFAGAHRAVFAWGPYSATGRVWHWLKDWLDRRQLRRYTM